MTFELVFKIIELLQFLNIGINSQILFQSRRITSKVYIGIEALLRIVAVNWSAFDISISLHLNDKFAYSES